MNEIHLTEDDAISDEEVAELKAEKLGPNHYDRVIGGPDAEEPVTVYKPNGEKLAVLDPNAISEAACMDAYRSLRDAAVGGGSKNRGVATGKGSKKRTVKKDGTISNTSQVAKEAAPNTGIAGFYDRYPRIPYCRQTAYNVNNPEKFDSAIPMFQGAASTFEQYAPERFAAQQERAQETVDDWVISETPFTTVTVNLNWQTAAHTDSGDFKPGFGVMTVVRLGDYEGAYYIMPKYRTAFDLHTGDVILSDVHEWHGNGPFRNTDGYYERLSCVLYYREDMASCGNQMEELERAKRFRDEHDSAAASIDDMSSEDVADEPQPTQRSTADADQERVDTEAGD